MGHDEVQKYMHHPWDFVMRIFLKNELTNLLRANKYSCSTCLLQSLVILQLNPRMLASYAEVFGDDVQIDSRQMRAGDLLFLSERI